MCVHLCVSPPPPCLPLACLYCLCVLPCSSMSLVGLVLLLLSAVDFDGLGFQVGGVCLFSSVRSTPPPLPPPPTSHHHIALPHRTTTHTRMITDHVHKQQQALTFGLVFGLWAKKNLETIEFDEGKCLIIAKEEASRVCNRSICYVRTYTHTHRHTHTCIWHRTNPSV